MSDEPDKAQKTEDPTQKRLDEAHRKGDVAKSQEIGHWFMLSAATLCVALFAGPLLDGLRPRLASFLTRPHEIAAESGELLALFEQTGWAIIAALALPVGILMAAAISSNLIQHKPVLSPNRIKPDFTKLSPLKGAQKFVSSQPYVDLLKSVAKIVVVGGIGFFVVYPELSALEQATALPPDHLLPRVRDLVLRMALGVVAAMAVFAALDFLYQRYTWFQKQKMTRQEVRDEGKQAEGDPQVKGRIRQLRAERARGRMMAAVPTADVVITNPTHYAVALKYDGTSMAAPKLVAKGADLIAHRIRDVAREHRIPIVENPPLARGLYAGVELEQEIPPEFYRAAAEVIGYVMGLRQKRAQARPVR